jgi:hypothetical protein
MRAEGSFEDFCRRINVDDSWQDTVVRFRHSDSCNTSDRCDIDDFRDLRSRLQRVNYQDGADRFRRANTHQQFVATVGENPTGKPALSGARDAIWA